MELLLDIESANGWTSCHNDCYIIYMQFITCHHVHIQCVGLVS